MVNVLGYKKKDGIVLVSCSDKVQGHALGIEGEERAALWELLTKFGNEKGGTLWLPPGVKGRVKFTTWSPKGNMRDCCWVRFVLDS